MLRVLLNGFSRFILKIFCADIKKGSVWSIFLYLVSLKVTTKTQLGYHSHGNIKQGSIFDWANIGCGFYGTHQLKNCTMPIMTWWLQSCRSVWTQSWVRSITRCVTKLILNCRHWDQSLHSYPPIISMLGPRGNPVVVYHQVHSVRHYQDSLYANAVDTMPLRSEEPWSESYCKRVHLWWGWNQWDMGEINSMD